MRLMISAPRSGSHVFKQMINAKFIDIVEFDRPSPIKMFKGRKRIVEILVSLKESGRFWTHLPYHKSYIDFVESCEDAFLLLRDPRDIILSHAHIESIPFFALNYKIDGRYFTDMPFRERIDFLIDNLRPILDWFELWRLTGIRTFYYEQFLESPDYVFRTLHELGYGTILQLAERAAKKNPYYFRLGVAGLWRREFTDAQKSKIMRQYGDLIEKWRPVHVTAR